MRPVILVLLPFCLLLLVACASTPEEPGEEEVFEETLQKPLINLGNIRQITNFPDDDARPSFSSDGTKIAFHSKRGGKFKRRKKNRDIWVVSIDGTDPKQLTTNEADDFNPAFSPDGKLIAYVSEADGTQDVWVMNTDGTGKKNLTADPGREGYPAWSPDGKRIVYSDFPEMGGDADLWTVTLEDGKKEKLTNIPGNEIFPTCHRDGNNIAFSTNKDGKLDIYVVDIKTKKVRRLIETAHRKTRPSFSPDGTMVAYAAWEDDLNIEPQIWVANANGTEPHQVTEEARNTHPAWSPTGTEIAFQSDRDGNWDIWMANVPEEVSTRAHFAFIGVIRGKDDKDVVKLGTGDTLTGKVRDEKIGLQTSYIRMDLMIDSVASINMASEEIFLINGDRLKGYILNELIDFETEMGQELKLRREKIESIAFGRRPEEPETFPNGDKIFFKNRDYLTGEAMPPTTITTAAAGEVDIHKENLKAMQFLDGTEEDVQLVFKNGDTLKGTVDAEDIAFQPFYGPNIKVYKGKVSEIVFKD